MHYLTNLFIYICKFISTFSPTSKIILLQILEKKKTFKQIKKSTKKNHSQIYPIWFVNLSNILCKINVKNNKWYIIDR
jgi:hypothetical protein